MASTDPADDHEHGHPTPTHPAAQPDLQPPSDEEKAFFFHGVGSRPRLVARTDAVENPWLGRLQRKLTSVTSRRLIDGWNDNKASIKTAITAVLKTHHLDWTMVLPVLLRVTAIGPGWETPANWDLLKAQAASTDESGALLIGVRKSSCSWEDGLAAANACRAIVAAHVGVSLATFVAEIVVVPLGDPEANAESDDDLDTEAAVNTEPPPLAFAASRLLELFDPKFGEISKNTGVYKYTQVAKLQHVNDQVIQFLPLAGQLIEQVLPSGRVGASGALCCFLQLTARDGTRKKGLFALVSRHVAVAEDFDHDKRLPSANAPELAIAWGTTEKLDSALRILDSLRAFLKGRLMELWEDMNDNPDDEQEQIAALADLCEKCADKCIKGIMAAIASEIWQESSTRKIGQVAYSAPHGLNRNNGWSDWAIVALDADPSDDLSYHHEPATMTKDTEDKDAKKEKSKSSGSLSAPQACINNVYLGRILNVFDDIKWSDYCSEPKKEKKAVLAGTSKAAFFRLLSTDSIAAPAPAPATATAAEAAADPGKDGKDSDHLHVRPRIVYKYGPKTKGSVGVVSPIEAILRKALKGRDEIVTWSLPIFGLYCQPNDDAFDKSFNAVNNMFSQPGDSGACVVDADGNIVSMLDGGATADKVHLYGRLHPGLDSSHSASGPAPLPAREPTPPPGLITGPLANLSLPERDPSLGPIDITFTTPMEWVLQDIEDVTHLKATIA